MGDVGRAFRPIAPRTMPPGGGVGGQPPLGSSGGGPPEDGRMKRASTACKECQKRRTRVNNHLDPVQCTYFSQFGSLVVRFFDLSSILFRVASSRAFWYLPVHFRVFFSNDFLLCANSAPDHLNARNATHMTENVPLTKKPTGGARQMRDGHRKS